MAGGAVSKPGGWPRPWQPQCSCLPVPSCMSALRAMMRCHAVKWAAALVASITAVDVKERKGAHARPSTERNARVQMHGCGRKGTQGYTCTAVHRKERNGANARLST
eukprot:352434-Chlamydomonas_euryale.AAC.1